jgi:hypothetical protein
VSLRLSGYDFALQGRATKRLIWVVCCNGFFLVASFAGIVAGHADVIALVILFTIFAGSMLGIGLELHGHRLASTVNVALPTSIGSLMVTVIAWAPLLEHFKIMSTRDMEDYLEAYFAFFMFSVIPFSLAATLKFVYILLAPTEPDLSSSARG